MVKKEKSATPAPRATPRATPSSQNGSILSFFSKKAASSTPTPSNGSSNGVLQANDTSKAVNAMPQPSVKKPAFRKNTVKTMTTPVPSSDAMGPSSSQENGLPDEVEDSGLLSPLTPAKIVQQKSVNDASFGSSPSRKAKKVVSYAESDDESDEDAFDPAGIKPKKRRTQKKVVEDDDEEDVFVGGLDGAADDDDGMPLLNES
jgi:DNA mismatch repair protein MSH6